MCYEIETGYVYDNFSKDNKKFCCSNYSVKSKFCDDSKALAVGEMNGEISGAAIEEYFALKPVCTGFY